MAKQTHEELPPASDESLLRVSISAFAGLKVLVDDGAGSHLIPAMGILSGHSLETCLKAYLMQEGKSEKDVKKFGHNLNNLWCTAEKAGLKISPNIPDWVTNLSAYYNHPYHLRYPPHLYGMSIHDPRLILEELGRIIDMIRNNSTHLL